MTLARERPRPSAAEVAASTFSTLKCESPDSVIGASANAISGSGVAPFDTTVTIPSSTVVARPPASIASRIPGEFESRENTHTFARVPVRIASVRGSSALSTHQPCGRVMWVMTALTSAS